MKDKRTVEKAVSLLSWLPSIALLLLYTYIPRYGIPVDGWTKVIAITCALCILVIPIGFSVFLVVAAVEQPCKRRIYLVAALIRLASALALAAYFPHSADLLPMLEEQFAGRQIWLDASYELNPQGYTTVALASSLITYLIGKLLFGKQESDGRADGVASEDNVDRCCKDIESRKNR